MKKLFLVILTLLLIVTSLHALTSCSSKGSASKVIGVVAKGESHAFWQSVKAGAEAAAKEKGYTITFRGPASESAKDLPSQQEMVQTALSNNVDGLVVATIGEGFTDMLTQAYDKKIPVVQFDSGIWEKDVEALESQNKNPIKATVATSNTLAASLAAEHFFEAVKEDISASEDYVIGVIQHDQTQTGIDRAKGFIDRFTELADSNETTKGRYRIEKEVKPGDAENAYKTALEALYEKGISALFMTNEGVVKQVFDAVGAAEGKYDNVKFCGFDAGTKQIEWMKSDGKAELIGSVAQDSYRIGYDAVLQCINAIEGNEVRERVDIQGVWWDSSNVDEMTESNIVYQG